MCVGEPNHCLLGKGLQEQFLTLGQGLIVVFLFLPALGKGERINLNIQLHKQCHKNHMHLLRKTCS